MPCGHPRFACQGGARNRTPRADPGRKSGAPPPRDRILQGTRGTLVQPEPPLPIIDGRYQLLRRIGEGGIGAVFEARHLGTGRRVAVKVIANESHSKNADVVDRFRREALASGAIESQHIAHVMDTGVDPSSGKPYLVMELLIGEDVEQALRRVTPFPPDLALRVVAQACLGLQRAHEEAVVHRDIKPANLFLARRDRDASELVVKILDFGIAKMKPEQLPTASTRTLTGSGSMVGSPLYMSPEQALGRRTIDHRTDIWSLGVVLYEALTGAAPHAYTETVGELLVSICHDPARPIQELAPWASPEVAAIVHRALAINPAARFASAREMFMAIQEQLPQGHALDKSMVAPMPSEQRAVVQERFFPPPALRIQAPSSGSLPQGVGADESGAMRFSTAALESRPTPTAGWLRPRSTGQVVAAALVAVGLGTGAYLAVGYLRPAPIATSSSVPAPAPHEPPSERPAGALPPPSAHTAEWVTVAPTATLETPTVSFDSLPRVVPAPTAPPRSDSHASAGPDAGPSTASRSSPAPTDSSATGAPAPSGSVAPSASTEYGF